MTDDLKVMMQEFTRDPDSLVFLRLGEALRLRGQLDAATTVAVTGLQRYSELLEAHDLYARLLLDRAELSQARRVWEGVIEIEPRHVGAQKGLGFVAYSEGDLDRALDHLETALAGDPTDDSIVQAIQVVRDTVAQIEAGEGESEQEGDVFQEIGGEQNGVLLMNTVGRLLAGGITPTGGSDQGEAVAAYLGGVYQEAERTSRLLDLGEWEWVVAEGTEGNVHVTRPTDDTLLLVVRNRSVPPGRLAYLAARANEAAREWLGTQVL